MILKNLAICTKKAINFVQDIQKRKIVLVNMEGLFCNYED